MAYARGGGGGGGWSSGVKTPYRRFKKNSPFETIRLFHTEFAEIAVMFFCAIQLA